MGHSTWQVMGIDTVGDGHQRGKRQCELDVVVVYVVATGVAIMDVEGCLDSHFGCSRWVELACAWLQPGWPLWNVWAHVSIWVRIRAVFEAGVELSVVVAVVLALALSEQCPCPQELVMRGNGRQTMIGLPLHVPHGSPLSMAYAIPTISATHHPSPTRKNRLHPSLEGRGRNHGRLHGTLPEKGQECQ